VYNVYLVVTYGLSNSLADSHIAPLMLLLYVSRRGFVWVFITFCLHIKINGHVSLLLL